MKYLFSQDGRTALKRLNSTTLFALDYDGTLAPIVKRPPDASIPRRTKQELRRLCRMASVAIISGRRLTDLTPRVPDSVRYLVGNHGNEGLPTATSDHITQQAVCYQWLAQIHQALEIQRPLQKLSIEDKGITLSLHTRKLIDVPDADEALAAMLRVLTPTPRIVGGIHVLNLLPPGAMCKDDAMQLLVDRSRARSLLYVGDDDCDELVFAQAPANWVTVRIGESRHSAARFFLPTQEDIAKLLLFINLQLGLRLGLAQARYA